MKKISISEITMAEGFDRAMLPAPDIKMDHRKNRTLCIWKGIGTVAWDQKLKKEDAFFVTWLWVTRGIKEIWISDKDNLSDLQTVGQLSVGAFLPVEATSWN